MGSGKRLKFWISGIDDGIGFGVVVCNFPFNLTIDVIFLCFCIQVGFGKGYDE